MYSAFRRLIFLLFTLLHLKSVVSILVRDHGYVYKAPPIKTSLPNFFDFQSQIPSHYSSSILPQQIPPPRQYHYGLSSPTFFDNFLHNDDDVYYTADGRLLKQYEVMESIIGDLQHPENFLGPAPLLLDSFIAKLNSQTNAPTNFFDFNTKLTNGQFIQPVTKNHGPVALGSGSLGYIRLANGAAYLGSGSLGYISGQQANQAINDAKTRKGISPPGPLHFGHGFNT